jgi:class 3 adenylate cyclase/tetratricopeptide (TPR) repeat protein
MDVVVCPGCGEENPAKFRLCGFCGTALTPIPETVACPGCGEENPSKFRLCGFCGTALIVPGRATEPASTAAAGSPAAPVSGPAASPVDARGAAPAPVVGAPPVELPAQEVRKPATFIFVDLKGSTALTERIDQEAMAEIKKRYFSAMAAQIERHGGTVEKYIGDAIMAVFGVPRAHEDDALRAVRAAHGMQQELTSLNEEFLRFYGVELANRTGVNTGEVVANTDPTANQQLATGDTVNVAARLEQAAPPNEILIGETTYDLVRAHVEVEPVEALELKGKAERVPAFRLVAVRDAPVERTSTQTTLVGRERELAALREAFEASLVRRDCRVVAVVGDAGVGKSRLLGEFMTGARERATVLNGRCLPYGDGITFWPFVEIVRQAARIVPDDPPDVARARLVELVGGGPEALEVVERVAAAIGLSAGQFRVPELFWGFRKLVERIAADRPVVLVIDDIHSAEPTLLELLGHLVDSVTGAAVLVLCSARHELAERHAEWTVRPGVDIMTLGQLSAEDSAAMIATLLGGASLEAAVVERVVTAADGNPLFVEQLVSMLIDRGQVVRVGDTWRLAETSSDVAIPPTIQALLAARLDDLSREERAVVEPASVIGLVFPRAAVEALVPEPVAPDVTGHLGTLGRKQLVRAAAGEGVEDEDAYRFLHILIRDAAYAALLKRARATYHERFVDWAEAENAATGRGAEFEEIHGYHLEQAFRYRSELGPLDQHGRDLARRAATKLGAAGRRASTRSDIPAAANLLRRAAALLPPDDPGRLELVADLGEALTDLGAFDEARSVLDEAAVVAASTSPRLAARIEVARLYRDLYASDETSGTTGAIAAAERAVATFEIEDDQAGLARALVLLALSHGTAGRYEAAAVAAERAVAAAAAADDAKFRARGAQAYVSAAVSGPLAVGEVLRRCEAMLADVAGDRKATAVIELALAQLYAMEGRADEGRTLYGRAQRALAELGPSVTASSTAVEASRVERLGGDLDAAERELRRDYEALEALGEGYYRSTIAGLLAGVLAERERDDEAEALTRVAEGLADEDDEYSQALWRMARARVLARRGDAAVAVELAEAAAALTAESSDIDFRADTLVELGVVLVATGRQNDAGPPWREALACYERKGDRVSADRVRERLAGLAGDAG